MSNGVLLSIGLLWNFVSKTCANLGVVLSLRLTGPYIYAKVLLYIHAKIASVCSCCSCKKLPPVIHQYIYVKSDSAFSCKLSEYIHSFKNWLHISIKLTACIYSRKKCICILMWKLPPNINVNCLNILIQKQTSWSWNISMQIYCLNIFIKNDFIYWCKNCLNIFMRKMTLYIDAKTAWIYLLKNWTTENDFIYRPINAKSAWIYSIH